MRFLWSSATFLSFLSCSLALSPTFLECQKIKTPGSSPLGGCPDGTVYVSSDTSDTNAQFHTVQGAVDSGARTILIAAGEYHETVIVKNQEALTLLGQLPATTSSGSLQSPFASASDSPLKSNLVKIWNDTYARQGIIHNADTAVLLVTPPSSAKNTNFRAYNIDFENRAAKYAIAQALAIDVNHGFASFYGCSFSSYQDTWFTGKNASTYVVDSICYGLVDYLFGSGKAWFQNTVLANRGCGGGIAAWRGTSSTDEPGNRYGAYIADSSIIRSPDANATTQTQGLCFLGRPWNEFATTVYLRTFMDDSINGVGWAPWNSSSSIPSTTFYAEFGSTGPGGNTSARAEVAHILTSVEAGNFTTNTIFDGKLDWIDSTYSF